MAASVCLGAPVAAWQAWRVLRGAWANPAGWNSLGLWAIALLLGTTAAELLSVLRLAGWR